MPRFIGERRVGEPVFGTAVFEGGPTPPRWYWKLKSADGVRQEWADGGYATEADARASFDAFLAACRADGSLREEPDSPAG